MEIAIIGLQQSGKSTLFEIMTGIKSSEIFGEQFVRGIAKVPDERFNNLVEIFKPEKVIPASVPFLDINASGEKAWNTIRQGISGVDGLLHVVAAYKTDSIDEIVQGYNKLEEEMILADLMIVENRLEKLLKLPKNALNPEQQVHLILLPKIKDNLEKGVAIRYLDFDEKDTNVLKQFAFLSMKPELVVLNVSEGGSDIVKLFVDKIANKIDAVSICCQVESEIALLPEEERLPFLESMGIKVPAFEKIVQAAFSLLGRIYYFTVGKDEVRAWSIVKGSTAPRAASVIHKDFERGFIKAEVASYDDFMNNGKDLAACKTAGKLRLEGKDYIVQDGDIINFRFNV